MEKDLDKFLRDEIFLNKLLEKLTKLNVQFVRMIDISD